MATHVLAHKFINADQVLIKRKVLIGTFSFSSYIFSFYVTWLQREQLVTLQEIDFLKKEQFDAEQNRASIKG